MRAHLWRFAFHIVLQGCSSCRGKGLESPPGGRFGFRFKVLSADQTLTLGVEGKCKRYLLVHLRRRLFSSNLVNAIREGVDASKLRSLSSARTNRNRKSTGGKGRELAGFRVGMPRLLCIRKQNWIHTLMDEHGTEINRLEELQDLFIGNFHKFWGVDGASGDMLPRLPGPSISTVDADLLSSDIDDQEIVDAVMALPLGKAPGLYGFGSSFFRCFWSLIKGSILLKKFLLIKRDLTAGRRR